MGSKVVGIVVAVVAAIIGYTVVGKLTGAMGSVMTVKSAPPAALQPGWKRFSSPQNKFTLDIPNSFLSFDPKGPEMEAVIQEAKKYNPNAEATLRSAAMSGEFALLSFNLKEVSDGYAMNINALRKDVGSELHESASSLASFKKGLLGAAPPGTNLISAEFVSLPIGRAIRSEVEMQIRSASGASVSHSIGYAVPDGTILYSITYSCAPAQLPKFKSVVEKSIQTLRVTK